MDSVLDLSQASLLASLLSIPFNPVAWNIVAQNGAASLSCMTHNPFLTFHSRIQK